MKTGPRIVVVLATFVTAALGASACSPPPSPAQSASTTPDVSTPDGKLRSEIAQYEKAVAQNPQDGKAQLALARAYRLAARYPESKAAAIVAADLMPTDRRAQLFAAEMMNAFREHTDAIARVAPLLKKSPTDAAALVMYGIAKARLRTADDVLIVLENGWRSGRQTDVILANIRVPPGRENDREAEEKIRLAVKVNPGSESRPSLALASLLCVTARCDDAMAVLETFLAGEPAHPLVLRVLGSRAAMRGLPAQAEAYFKRAIATGDQESIRSFVAFYTSNRREREALDLINSLAARDTTGEGLAQAAEIEMKLGMVDQAAAHIDALLARFPDHSDGRVLRARVLLIRGQAAEAAALARSVATIAPWTRLALATLGRALWKTGDAAGAYEELVKAWRRDDTDPVLAAEIADLATQLGKFDVAVEFAERRVALDPGNTAAVVILGAAQIRAGQVPSAERTLAKLPADLLKTPDALVALGALHAVRGRHDAARASYSEALKLLPDSLTALTGLFEADVASGQPAQSRTLIDQAAQRHSAEAPFLILAARAAAASRDVGAAESRLRSALSVDPSSADASIQLARLLAGLGKPTEARKVLEDAMARNHWSAALRFELAGVLEREGRLLDAQKRYEDAIGLDAASHLASARIASLIVRQNGNLDVALRYASAAKQGLPSNPEVDDTLGWIMVLKRRAAVGLPHLEAAVKAQPNQPTYRYHLGAAYDQLGRFPDARRELVKALEIDSAFPGAADAKKLLAAIGG